MRRPAGVALARPFCEKAARAGSPHAMSLEITQLAIEGVKLITPPRYLDARDLPGHILARTR
jgi:hypothetical protein